MASGRFGGRVLKSAVIAMLLALALWEVARLDYRREFSDLPERFSALGRSAIALGGLFGGILFARAPRVEEEPKGRRYIRWVGMMVVVLLPSAVIDLFRGTSIATVGWTVAVALGLALTAWLVEQRLQFDSDL